MIHGNASPLEAVHRAGVGRNELGGLAVALTALNLGVFVAGFLATVTGQRVAYRTGGGDRSGAARSAVAAYWLALGLGLLLAAVAVLAARPVVAAESAASTSVRRSGRCWFMAPGIGKRGLRMQE